MSLPRFGRLDTPRTKTQFRQMYQDGAFGNKLRTWQSYQDLCDSDYHGNVSARHKQAVSGLGRFLYNVPADLLRNGPWPLTLPSSEFHFNETPPDGLMLIQGEVSRQPHGLDLQYSTECNISLRDAINHKPSLTATGIKAAALLSHYLWPRSLDDLYEMLDAHSDGVIEFSTFSKAVGHLPQRNTIIWEVRRY